MLRVMDWTGNARYGVRLPSSYLTIADGTGTGREPP
jgi:hypothetical protein